MATAQHAGPPGQPNIGYTPDLDNYLARVKRRLGTESLPKSLPAGFPEQLKSDLVWTGEEVEKSYNWVQELTEDELEDIENGLLHFKCRLGTSRNSNIV